MAEEILIDFGQICRFCLVETDGTISISENLGNSSADRGADTICSFMSRMTLVKMSGMQNFPSFVCRNCYNIISVCYNFCQVCKQSDISLKDCYNRTLNETKAQLNFEEWDENGQTKTFDADNPAMKKITCHVNVDIKSEDQINNGSNKNNISEIAMEKIGKDKVTVNFKNSMSTFKANNIKQKYQRMNTLSTRLKEAQSKLMNDILRSNDLLSDSTKKVNSIIGKTSSHDCHQCALKFTNVAALQLHYLTSHKQKRAAKMVFGYQCKICHRSFSEQSKLIKHTKSIHKQIVMDCNKPDQLQPIVLSYDSHTKKEEDSHMLCDFSPSNYRNSGSSKASTDNKLLETDCALVNNIIAEKNISCETHPGAKSSTKNVFRLFICTDCTPPVSFTDVNVCLKHKLESHNQEPGNNLHNELPIPSVNLADDQNKEGKSGSGFKVSCKNCIPPLEFAKMSAFVSHMTSQHDTSNMENWDIESKPLTNGMEEGKYSENKWKCSECPAVYFRRHSLHYHMKEKHKKIINVNTMKCPDCEETFLTSRQLIRHGIRTHQKYFANFHKVYKKILQPTTEEEYRNKNFECDICQKKYVCKNSLKRHILKVHLGRAESETAVCPYCGKTLTSKLNLKSHIEFVHEALFVSCPICKKKINFKTIGKHYKVHQTDVEFNVESGHQFLCNLCGKILKSKRSFEDHQKLHKNIRDELCDICGSGFTTKKFLYLHKKTHEGGKRKVFGCPQCDKVFSGRHTLNRHLLTHSGEKNFICEICSKCFYTLQELNRHVRYHKKEYRFDCQLCDMRFLDKSRFRHHMMRHRNIRPHKCQFCDKMFIVRRKMNLHMAAKHNVEIQSTKGVWKDPKTYVSLDDLL
ncbi:hypothetical protein RUM44_012742 [Polyplax serrata]|uniref:Uncharacterized protein n=1 Tax=Polyplax serrata TaxID=468196 RepID=A0ABR1BC61_POLSC